MKTKQTLGHSFDLCCLRRKRKIRCRRQFTDTKTPHNIIRFESNMQAKRQHETSCITCSPALIRTPPRCWCRQCRSSCALSWTSDLSPAGPRNATLKYNLNCFVVFTIYYSIAFYLPWNLRVGIHAVSHTQCEGLGGSAYETNSSL